MQQFTFQHRLSISQKDSSWLLLFLISTFETHLILRLRDDLDGKTLTLLFVSQQLPDIQSNEGHSQSQQAQIHPGRETVMSSIIIILLRDVLSHFSSARNWTNQFGREGGLEQNPEKKQVSTFLGRLYSSLAQSYRIYNKQRWYKIQFLTFYMFMLYNKKITTATANNTGALAFRILIYNFQNNGDIMRFPEGYRCKVRYVFYRLYDLKIITFEK